MAEKIYKKVTRELMLESTDFRQFNAPQFKDYAQSQINEYLKSLPTDADYIVQEDLKPLGVNCVFLYIGATPAVLQVSQYTAKTKSLLVHLRADYLEEVKPNPPETVPTEVTNG